MQIHYSSLKFCDEHDEDTTIIVNKYFIRARGFTAWEIITAAKNHQIFEEDTVLSNHRDYLKSQVIKRVSYLTDQAFPEEMGLPSKERMNKATVLGKFFQERKLQLDRSFAPTGEMSASFEHWEASPGTETVENCYAQLLLS